MRKIMLIIGVMAFMLSTHAGAVTIDFSVFPHGNTGSTTLITPEATFQSFGGNFFIGAAGIASEICALNANSFDCQSDFQAVFTSSINDLTLVTSGYNPGDIVYVKAYNSGGTLLGTVMQNKDGLVDLTAFSGIQRLYFDDQSTGAGFGYDHFTFNVASVPEPATMLLLVAGLSGLFCFRRKFSR
jgi:hypothetical protein